MLKNVLLIGTGGFIGSVARYYLSKLNVSINFLSIPVGTLCVNVLGSFAIGFLTGISEKSVIMTVEMRMLLMVGLCGGFTTFSSFTSENLMLIHSGQYFSMILYTVFSLILSFSAVYLGYASTTLL